MKKKTILLSFMAGIILLPACKNDDNNDTAKPTLQVPVNYESAAFEQNTAKEKELKDNLNKLVSYMKTGQDTIVKLSLTQLNSLYTSGTLAPLANNAHPNFSSIITANLFPSLENNSGQSFDPADGASATTGGVYGGRLLNSKGYEILQGVDKGFYAAGFYHQLALLSRGEINETALDQMLALYGAHPSFPNTGSSNKATHPDAFIANYTARRDKNDGAGLYTDIKRNFLTIKEALKDKENFSAELNTALSDLRLNIEKALVATSYNYAYSAIGKFSKTNPTDADLAGALHDLGEAVSFIYGFKGVDAQNRLITDAQIDELISKMGLKAGGNDLYLFVTNPVNELPRLTAALDRIAEIYGFTPQQTDDFRYNWVSVQNR